MTGNEEVNWNDDADLDDSLDGHIEGWETFEVDDPPIHVVLMRFLSVPILIVAIGLRWIARTLQQRLRR